MSDLSTLVVYIISINIRNVHHQSLQHKLSDGDNIAVQHIHDGMVCRHPINIVYIISAMSV